MSVERCIVTITDVIGPTSMPFNEFVLYRREHYKNERQIVILLFKDKVNDNIVIPDDLEVHCVGKHVLDLHRLINEIDRECIKDNVDLIFHIHEAKTVVLFDLATFGKYRDKVVYTLHSTYSNYRSKTKVLCRLASARCKAIVCVSNTSFRRYPQRMKNKYNVFPIQNGVSTERINEIRKEEVIVPHQKLKMAYVARLVPLKRHSMLLNIVARIPEVELYVIGDGPLMNELKSEVESNGIEERVVFTGPLARDDVYKKLINMDLYVSTSSYEGLPVSVLEAMACGVPCVISDIEQHREIKEKCEAVCLADNEDDWLRQIGVFEKMTAEARHNIGVECMKQVQKSFSLESMHEKYNRVYGGKFE